MLASSQHRDKHRSVNHFRPLASVLFMCSVLMLAEAHRSDSEAEHPHNIPPGYQPLDLTFVIHRHGDPVSMLFAFMSFTPFAVVMMWATVILVRREIEPAFGFLGMLVCTASNLVLKRLIKQPRPAGSHKSGYGMPSNHSQFMCFIACYFTLWLLHKASFGARTTKHRSSSEKGSNNDKNSTNSTRSRTSCFCVLAESPLGYAIKIALIAGLWALSFLVIYGRLYLGVHSVEQVAVGGICGVIISVLWYVVVGEICVRPFYPSIVRSQVCRFFYVKDSSSIDNVLLFEYQNYISATEASASLLPPTAKKADLYSLKTSRTGNIRSRGRKERKEKNTSTL